MKEAAYSLSLNSLLLQTSLLIPQNLTNQSHKSNFYYLLESELVPVDKIKIIIIQLALEKNQLK